jgi:hypothetical protein
MVIMYQKWSSSIHQMLTIMYFLYDFRPEMAEETWIQCMEPGSTVWAASTKELRKHLIARHGALKIRCPWCTVTLCESSKLALHVQWSHPEMCDSMDKRLFSRGPAVVLAEKPRLYIIVVSKTPDQVDVLEKFEALMSKEKEPLGMNPEAWRQHCLQLHTLLGDQEEVGERSFKIPKRDILSEAMAESVPTIAVESVSVELPGERPKVVEVVRRVGATTVTFKLASRWWRATTDPTTD